MVTTTYTFTSGVLTPDNLDEIKAKVTQMKAAGQTNGITEVTENYPLLGQAKAVRTWNDRAAAEEWLAFMRTFGHMLFTEITE